MYRMNLEIGIVFDGLRLIKLKGKTKKEHEEYCFTTNEDIHFLNSLLDRMEEIPEACTLFFKKKRGEVHNFMMSLFMKTVDENPVSFSTEKFLKRIGETENMRIELLRYHFGNPRKKLDAKSMMQENNTVHFQLRMDLLKCYEKMEEYLYVLQQVIKQTLKMVEEFYLQEVLLPEAVFESGLKRLSEECEECTALIADGQTVMTVAKCIRRGYVYSTRGGWILIGDLFRENHESFLYEEFAGLEKWFKPLEIQLLLVLQSGKMKTHQIQEQFDTSARTIERILQVLTRKGLIIKSRKERDCYYELDRQTIHEMAALLQKMGEEGKT